MTIFSDALRNVMELPGVRHLCCAEKETGAIIAERGIRVLDPEEVVAWAGRVGVLLARSREADELDDLMITSSRHYHLLRQVEADGWPPILVYLCLDRARSNLALARRELAVLNLPPDANPRSVSPPPANPPPTNATGGIGRPSLSGGPHSPRTRQPPAAAPPPAARPRSPAPPSASAQVEGAWSTPWQGTPRPTGPAPLNRPHSTERPSVGSASAASGSQSTAVPRRPGKVAPDPVPKPAPRPSPGRIPQASPGSAAQQSTPRKPARTRPSPTPRSASSATGRDGAGEARADGEGGESAPAGSLPRRVPARPPPPLPRPVTAPGGVPSGVPGNGRRWAHDVGTMRRLLGALRCLK